AHPEEAEALLRNRAPPPTLIEATTALPPAQREWTCGLCDAGLPTLGRAQGRLSRRSHWQKCHDDVSFEEFCRKVVMKRNLAVQQERFPEHALVALPYRGHAENVEYRKDGTRVTMTQFRCKRCLFAVAGASVASKQLRHGLSCEQNRQYTLTDSSARSQLREWWLGVGRAGEGETLRKLECDRGFLIFLVDDWCPVAHTYAPYRRRPGEGAEEYRERTSHVRAQALAHRIKYRRKHWNPRQSRKKEAAKGCRPLAKHEEDQEEDGDVEPHPGPASKKGRPWATTWTVNVGLGETSWQALEAASQAEIDIVFLQEVGLTDQDCAAFEARARKFGYRSYFSGGAVAQSTAPHRAGRPTGGVGTLVFEALRSRRLDHLVGEDAQAVAVRVEDLVAVNLYQPPGKARDEAMSFVLGLLETLSRKHTWCIAGGFNDEPGENLLWDLLREEGHLVKDHRVVAAHLQVVRGDRGVREPDCILGRSANLGCPGHVEPERWCQLQREVYATMAPPSFPAMEEPRDMGAMQKQVDDVWKQTSLYLEHFFRMEHQEEHAGLSVRDQQLDNLRGRMRHMQWLQRRGREESAEGRMLEERIGLTKNRLVTLKEVEAKLAELRKQRRQGRIDRWRNRLRGSLRACCAWVEGGCAIPSTGVRAEGKEEGPKGEGQEGGARSEEDEAREESATEQEALALLARHWRGVWGLELAPQEEWQQRVEDALPPASEDIWRPVCPMELRGAMGRLRGSAPGADGWRGDELASLNCPAVVHHLADVFNFMLGQGCAPTEWRTARQVMPPKGGKGRRKKDGGIAVQALRPIAILSCWRRLLGSVLLRPDYDYDYTLAFDRADPELAVAVSRKLGCPRAVAAILEQVWAGQLQYLQCQGAALRRPEEVGASLTQGDPWSMIAMVAVLHLPITAVVARFPGAELSCFVGDRSWKSSTAQELLAVGEEWRKWSLVLGLKETEAKSQHARRAAAGKKQLLRAGAPDAAVTDAPEILG
ncbi:unnamed protein product, partial [Prorocentrum cordatum]